MRKIRNSSIELLRIVAAYLIVLRHFVGANGFNVWVQPLSAGKVFLEAVLFPAGKVGVVLFFLISAWFLCEGSTDMKDSLRRVWILEREILFYSLMLTVFMLVLHPDRMSLRMLLSGVFPVSTDLWWYATSYVVFLVLSPFLTTGLRALGERMHRGCCVACLVMWTLLGGLVSIVSFDMTQQNVMIFVYLYVLVSYWRWYQPFLISHRRAWILIGSGLAVSVASVVVLSILTVRSHRGEKLQAMMGQNEWMLPVMMISFGMFALFEGIEFHNRAINSVAKSMFAVYLISVYPPLADIIWREWFDMGSVYGTVRLVPYAFGTALAVLVACVLIDYIRRGIFRLTVDRHSAKWFNTIWNKAVERYAKLLVYTSPAVKSVYTEK